MQGFLESRLHDPKVGVDDLSSAFRCFRATVFRLFGECGGVRAFLTERRLVEAFQLLTDSPDAPYFHRAFKRRYGFTPREAEETVPPPETPGRGCGSFPASSDAVATIHRWMGIGA